MRRIACTVLLVVSAALVLAGQTGQWLTFGHDPQRSGWARDEHTFSPTNVANLGLAWSVSLPVTPRSLTALTAPIVIKGVGQPGRARDEVIVAGASDHVFALDAHNGAILWQRALPIAAKMPSPGMWLCPNNLNDTPVADPKHGRLFVIAADGRLDTLSWLDGHSLLPPLRFVPPYAKMWSLNYVDGVLYTSVSQDCNDAHSAVYAMNPDAPGHSVSVFWSAQECPHGGFCGAGIWGRGGPAADFAGSIYGATGDAAFDPRGNEFGDTVLRLSPRHLGLQDYFTPADWNYITAKDLDMGNTTPVIFRWRRRVLAAAAGKMGVVYLLDTAALGGTGHHRPLYTSPRLSNDAQTFERYGIWGGMSSWQDARGQVWLLVPTWGPPAQTADFPRAHGPAPDGSVLAFKVSQAGAGARLEAVWRSRDIAVPDPVAIAGGVIFVLGTGENTAQVYNGDIHRLIQDRQPMQANHAAVYALDAATGRELWSSGDTIAGWTHFSGAVVAAGKVFAVTHGGQVYAFGLHGHAQPVSAASAGAAVPPPTAPAETTSAGPSRSQPGCAAAQATFSQTCSTCHGLDGKGYVALHTPNFTDSQWQAAHADRELVGAITHGLRDQGYMPPFENALSATQIDALVHCVVRGFAAPEPHR